MFNSSNRRLDQDQKKQYQVQQRATTESEAINSEKVPKEVNIKVPQIVSLLEEDGYSSDFEQERVSPVLTSRIHTEPERSNIGVKSPSTSSLIVNSEQQGVITKIPKNTSFVEVKTSNSTLIVPKKPMFFRKTPRITVTSRSCESCQSSAQDSVNNEIINSHTEAEQPKPKKLFFKCTIL